MTQNQRMNELIDQIAKQAYHQPLLDSGLWFHGDIRDNFYYASYLIAFAAKSDKQVERDELGGNDDLAEHDSNDHLEQLNKERAMSLASGVLLQLLALQNRNKEDQLYGHWPLRVNPDSAQLAYNALPAEIMGSLMVYFYQRFSAVLPAELKAAFTETFDVLHQATYYKKPLHMYNHHEAKYTASKLIFGELFQDKLLFDDGRRSLSETLHRLQREGMPEYSALPWFWHWVQAFTAALACVTDEQVRADLRRMLDYLWNERAEVYLGGAWAGARMRSWPHDLPRDNNVAFDYVQFGGFHLPEQHPRIEYAGLLFYDAGDSVRQKALIKQKPTERKKLITPAGDEASIQPLHSYLYMTERYAAGGVWERAREFDNEQHRWEITFPLNTADGGVNRLYAFQPGDGYREGDPRHQNENGEVLFHENVIIAHYPALLGEADERLIGILPAGEWVTGQSGLYGYVQQVYVSISIEEPYTLAEETDRVVMISQSPQNGIIVEVVDELELEGILPSIHDLASFGHYMDNREQTMFHKESEGAVIAYKSLRGDQLTLRVEDGSLSSRTINGKAVNFTSY